MKIEWRNISTITPYPDNPRINAHAVDAVAASILEFGWQQPIVVDEHGTIIAGHTRYEAARQLGMDQVPVHVAHGLTPAQVKAYRLADNQTADLAQWDDQLLTRELSALEGMGFDLNLLGFSADELTRLLDVEVTPGLVDPDEIPQAPDQARTRPGDLWILGDHRVLCGDAGRQEDVERLLEAAPIHLAHTDPPYNVRLEPRSQNASAAGLNSCAASQHRHKVKLNGRKLRPRDRPLANDFMSEEKYHRLLHDWFGNVARVLQPGRSFYIWGGYTNCGNYPLVLKQVDLYFSQAIIWVKQHPVLSRKDFMGNHEWCFYGWHMGAAHQFFGSASVTDVWSVKKVAPQALVHLTEKPVELAVRALQYSSKPKENVLDLFGGSGSTLIAAEQTGRRAFLMELDAAYTDVIVQRWESFTGRRAELRQAP